jgi:hypothetical protein
MRLQRLKQIAAALSADHSERVAAKTVIVAEVERLRWRIWNGKAKNARKSIDRIRAAMSLFQGEAGGRKSIAPSRKLWTALHALDGYLSGQSAWLVNYAERPRAGLRVGPALTEGTAKDALAPTWGRFAASGSLRHLQWHFWLRFRTEVPGRQRSIPTNSDRRLTPKFAAVPRACLP